MSLQIENDVFEKKTQTKLKSNNLPSRLSKVRHFMLCVVLHIGIFIPRFLYRMYSLQLLVRDLLLTT